jgi:2-phospho-L-lactate guanylyltransferase
MSLWAIVPVKPLRRGKSRLSEILSEDERYKLNDKMLNHILGVLSSLNEVDEILVLSRDSGALATAREYGARTLQEESGPKLNMAIQRGMLVAKTFGARAILVLAADLPLVGPGDIQELLKQAGNPPELIVAPDRHNSGTNALYVCPPDIIQEYMGEGSLSRHLKLAEEIGLHVKVCDLYAFKLDIDYPDDLELLRAIESM